MKHYLWDFSRECTLRFCASDDPRRLYPHQHKYTELTFFYRTDGGRYFVNGAFFDIRSGDLLIANSYEMHGCEDFGANCLILCVQLELGCLPVEAVQQLVFPNRIRNDPHIDAVFRELWTLARNDDSYSPAEECMLYAKTAQLLALLSAHPQTTARRGTKRQEQELHELILYMDSCIQKPVRVEELTDRMCLSPDRFSHVFRKYTGMSPIRYLQNKRIDRACTLLRETDYSITRIAQECGFCTSSYFSKQFLALMKQTPGDYRRQKELFSSVITDHR